MARRARKVLVMASILALLTGGFTAMGLSGAAESWLFYFPSRRAFRDPPGVEAVTFKTADGLTLSGWYWAALDEARERNADDEGATGRGSGRPVPEGNEATGGAGSSVDSENHGTSALVAQSSD